MMSCNKSSFGVYAPRSSNKQKVHTIINICEKIWRRKRNSRDTEIVIRDPECIISFGRRKTRRDRNASGTKTTCSPETDTFTLTCHPSPRVSFSSRVSHSQTTIYLTTKFTKTSESTRRNDDRDHTLTLYSIRMHTLFDLEFLFLASSYDCCCFH